MRCGGEGSEGWSTGFACGCPEFESQHHIVLFQLLVGKHLPTTHTLPGVTSLLGGNGEGPTEALHTNLQEGISPGIVSVLRFV